MFEPKTNQEGLSLSTNRVALPIVSTFEETYTKLPAGLSLGFIAEVENTGLKGVLCKNGSTEIDEWLATETNLIRHQDSNLAAAVAAGSFEVGVTINATAANLPEDSLKGGYLWIVGGTGLKDNGAARKFLIKGNEAGTGSSESRIITLVAALPAALDTTTDVIVLSSMFNNTKVGSATLGHKTLGQSLIVIPANEYYWAVFEGDVPANAGAIANGTLVKKGASGAYVAATAAANSDGFVKYQTTTTVDIVSLHIQGIYVQNA